MIVANNLPFNLLRTVEFREAMHAISAYGLGYVPPSSETARTKILESLKGDVVRYVEQVKTSWASTGCTIMLDSWTDGRKRPHINLLVSCPKGIIFLKSECTVGKKKDANYIVNFICSGIEEIGPENVVQFISDNASNYSTAGIIVENRFSNIFKTSCAAHCLDLILESIDELPNVKVTLESARNLVKFFYKFQHVLDLMRTHTNGRELKRPGATRFATQFLCLQSIVKEEQPLRFIVASTEWRLLPQSKTTDGIEVMDTIQGNTFWESAREILSTVEPLVRVLRMVDGDGSTMGYLYESMDRAKEAIKYFYRGDIDKYGVYWKIIDERWNRTLHSPLHAVAAYLNPQLFYDKLVKLDKEVKLGLEKVILKMFNGPEANNMKKEIGKELTIYHKRDVSIFCDMAIDGLADTHPRIWWEMWGIEVPNIQKLAIKLHSQPCSASGCEGNWSAFEAAHTKKRNRLEPKKLHDLVFIRMNLHFMKTCEDKERKDSEPIHMDKISAFPDVPNDDVVGGGGSGGSGGSDTDTDDEASESENEDAHEDNVQFDDFDRLMNPSFDLGL